MNDSTARTLAKTITWRVTGSSATLMVSYVLSGDFAIASSIAITQLFFNTILYFFHERIWNKVPWGIK